MLLLLTVGLEECLGGMGAASSLFWRITRVLLFLTGLEGSLGSRFIAVVSNWIHLWKHGYDIMYTSFVMSKCVHMLTVLIW